MQIHHVADHERLAFVTAQHAGRERPRDLQLADVVGGDLLQCRVARVGEVTRRHDPLARDSGQLGEFVVCVAAPAVKTAAAPRQPKL